MADLDFSHYFIRAFVNSSFPKIVSQVILVFDDFLVDLLKLVEVNGMPLVFDKLCEFIAYFLDILLHLVIVSFQKFCLGVNTVIEVPPKVKQTIVLFECFSNHTSSLIFNLVVNEIQFLQR